MIGTCEEGMAMKRYRVKRSAEERQELRTLMSRGRAAAYKQTHGRVPRFHGAGSAAP